MADRQLPRRGHTHLLPTLIDRLVDDEPGVTSEAPSQYAVSARRMREIVQRDISWLLNATSFEDELHHLRDAAAASSVINFGVPAFAGHFMAERHWADVERVIRQAILNFEPRLIPDSLQVLPLLDRAGESHYNVLTFEIRGLIHMQPYPTEFMVQSTMDLETHRLDLKL